MHAFVSQMSKQGGTSVFGARVKEFVRGLKRGFLDPFAGILPVELLWSDAYLLYKDRQRRRLLSAKGRFVNLPLFGYTLALDLYSLHDYLQYEILRSGSYYEYGTTQLLRRKLKSGDTFVDVGANNGYFTLMAASLTGPSGLVLSIEPNPACVARLRNNVWVNCFDGRVKVMQIALGGKEGSGVLSFPSHFEAHGTLLSRRRGEKITVLVETFDRLFRDLHPSIVKVDIEGSEESVIEGMTSAIESSPSMSLIVEWNSLSSRSLYDALTRSFRVLRIVEHGAAAGETVTVGRFQDLRRLRNTNLFCEPLESGGRSQEGVVKSQ